jgi:GT2 family glycosyltransferase
MGTGDDGKAVSMSGIGQVSIVVITRDRWPDLQQSLPRHEAPVVLVDNGSMDGTPDLVRAHFPHVEVIALKENRGAVARNIGVHHARTPYVAFSDDDSWWSAGALSEAVGAFTAHPRLGLLAGRVLVGLEEREDPICDLMSQSPLREESDLPGPSVLGFLACGAVVRRAAFLAAGGFDEVVFFTGEEERLALDLATLGWGLSYVSEVVAHHHPSLVRDPSQRQALAGRNRLLTLVLRRPWRVVGAEVAACLHGGPAGRAALRQALPRLPRALRQRRVVPPHVEAARVALNRVYAPKAPAVSYG